MTEKFIENPQIFLNKKPRRFTGVLEFYFERDAITYESNASILSVSTFFGTAPTLLSTT